MICCLSTRTSASSAARDRNRSTTKPKISLQRSHIQCRIVRFSADCQPDQIYDRDRFNRSSLRDGRMSAYGQTAAEPTINVTKSRRLTAFPPRLTTKHRIASALPLEEVESPRSGHLQRNNRCPL